MDEIDFFVNLISDFEKTNHPDEIQDSIKEYLNEDVSIAQIHRALKKKAYGVKYNKNTITLDELFNS